MKYKIETFPNENCVDIHLKVKRRLIASSFASFDEPTSQLYVWDGDCSVPKPRPAVVGVIWDIAGIARINLTPYSIGVTKASAFDWKEILPAIIAAINLAVCQDEQMELDGSYGTYGGKSIDGSVLAAI